MTKNILITGANRGIGLALTELYRERGDQVYAVCRKSSERLNSLSGVTIIEGIDVTNASQLLTLKQQMHNIKLDILINNAGILTDEVLGEIDFERIMKQFDVNAMGPLRTTEALLQNLSAGSKVALITSRMGSIADNTSGGRYGYRMSKAALNAAGMSLARDLEKQQIPVALLHPGYVQTDMVNHTGDISPAVAATRLAQRIDELSLSNSGSFWHANGEQLPW